MDHYCTHRYPASSCTGHHGSKPQLLGFMVVMTFCFWSAPFRWRIKRVVQAVAVIHVTLLMLEQSAAMAGLHALKWWMMRRID